MQTNLVFSISIALFLMFGASCPLHAQAGSDAASNSDVIIRVDGEILYGKVVEISSDEVKYKRSDIADGPVISLPRGLVYAVSYRNNTFEVVTPVLGDKDVNLNPFDQSIEDSEKETTIVYAYEEEESDDDPDDNSFSENIKRGSVKVALGFSREYSSLQGVDDFSKSAGAPSLFVAYQFQFNRLFKVGANLGFAAFDYRYASFSDYDQIRINQEINERIYTLGFYGRYDLLEGFVKPYLLLGVNFNYSTVSQDGEVFFVEEQKRLNTNSGFRGFKPYLVLRGGVDINLSDRFGVYSDIGTGTSLVQIGVIFILE